jgi:hypothetical protein
MQPPATRAGARTWRILVLALLVSIAGGCAANAGGGEGGAPRLQPATMLPGSRRPDLTNVREEINLMIEVMVDSAGNPDLRTLRVTGPGAMQTQPAIANWIQVSRFKPGEQGGRPVSSVFRTRLRTRIETRRVAQR